MWQFFALGSVVAGSLEIIADKFALVDDKGLDFGLATFCRVVLYTVLTAGIGLLGWLGELHFYLSGPMLLFGVFSAISAYVYTYLLRKVEVTGIGAAGYIMPLLFLLADTTIVHDPLSILQITGVCLLVVGGFGFAIDGKTHRLKKELSAFVWMVMVLDIAYLGAEAYFFKYLNTTQGVNSVSFLASAWGIAALALSVLPLLQGKLRLLFVRETRTYIARATLSKSFDAVGSLFFVQALVFASVSQVSAMGALSPLVLLSLAFVAQKLFGLNLEERLGSSNFMVKAGAVALLIVGGFLVS